MPYRRSLLFSLANFVAGGATFASRFGGEVTLSGGPMHSSSVRSPMQWRRTQDNSVILCVSPIGRDVGEGFSHEDIRCTTPMQLVPIPHAPSNEFSVKSHHMKHLQMPQTCQQHGCCAKAPSTKSTNFNGTTQAINRLEAAAEHFLNPLNSVSDVFSSRSSQTSCRPSSHLA